MPKREKNKMTERIIISSVFVSNDDKKEEVDVPTFPVNLKSVLSIESLNVQEKKRRASCPVNVNM